MIAAVLVIILIVVLVNNRHGGDKLTRFFGRGGKPPATEPEHLAFIARYMRAHNLTPGQLAAAWDMPDAVPPAPPKEKTGDIAPRLFFWLGAVLIFGGLGTYMGVFWDSMPSFMRIFVTLGTGMGLTVFAVIAIKEGRYTSFLLPLILLAAAVETSGWFVFVHELFSSGGNPAKAALFCFGIMAVQQAALCRVFKRDALAFTVLVLGYGAFAALLDLMGMEHDHAALLVGISLLGVSHGIALSPYRALSGLACVAGLGFFCFGLFGALTPQAHVALPLMMNGIVCFAAARHLNRQNDTHLARVVFFFALLQYFGGTYDVIADYSSNWCSAMVTGASLCAFGLGLHVQERYAGGPSAMVFIGALIFYAGLFDGLERTPFELLYFAVCVSVLYVAARLQSRPLLIVTVLAMLAFIGYFTSRHFMHSLGWPVALMIMGAACVGVGTLALKWKRRYQQ